MAVPRPGRSLRRRSHYAFTCGRCRLCCREKRIQVNPYEVARLARHLGLSTTAFIRAYTCRSGAYLKFTEADVCPFLTEQGCGVHPDRPLVCRLYPLGRHVADTGEEWFSELEPDDGCAGARGTATTVLAYLKSQGALPFMQAADLYLALYWKLAALVETPDSGRGPERAPDVSWADLDVAVSDYCRETNRPIPATVEEKMLLHIQAIETWAEAPEQGGNDEKQEQ